MKNVKMWLNANELSANATKTEFMIVGSKNLTWENHIEEIAIPKVLKGLRMILTL